MSKLKKAQLEVKMILSSMQLFLKLLPPQKQQFHALSIGDIQAKYKHDADGNINNFKRDLEYKYNFLKLAYPHISTKIQPEVEIANKKIIEDAN